MSYASEMSRHRHGVSSRAVGQLAALSCLLLLVLLSGTAAAEEETHFFDATLSLNGGCGSTALDPVPDPGCPDIHPPQTFNRPAGVAVDRYGNRYVASAGSDEDGSEGRIDIFDSSGVFITEIEVELPAFAPSLAVDSQGYLYVGRDGLELPSGSGRLLRYEPTKYNPAAGEIEYADPPASIPNPYPSEHPGEWGDFNVVVAVNPANDHLLVATRSGVNTIEFGPAPENQHLGALDLELVEEGRWATSIAIDSVRNIIYATDLNAPAITPGSHPVVRAFALEAPHDLLFTVDGSNTPNERFVSETRVLPLAVDEGNGHLFVGDLEAPSPVVYEFEPGAELDAGGNLVSSVGVGKLKATSARVLQLAYDDSPTSPTEGYLFVPSGASPGRSLAFEPKPPVTVEPAVSDLSISGLTSSEAVAHATINPGGLETTYRIEYEGGGESRVAAEGTLGVSNQGVAVSASIAGLSPGTVYRYRVIAENEAGADEAEAEFSTYASVVPFDDCPNQSLRTGASAGLPDCRAYELVTPADTNGHPPFGKAYINTFPTRLVSPDGNKVPFVLEGAPLPGLEGTGSFKGDPYVASRTPAGWSPAYIGPPSSFAAQILPGSTSPDQGYSFWRSEGDFSPASVAPGHETYLRYPDGHSELPGQGSIGETPYTTGEFIAPAGGHVIFSTGGEVLVNEPAAQLEPSAAPGNTVAVYDRTADGVLHVVSVKTDSGPGHADVPFSEGQDAYYQGASPDGVGVAFEVGDTLYYRYDNTETFEIGENVGFAGVSEGGRRIFYLEGGDLKAFDVDSRSTIGFSVGGDSVPVLVAPDGSSAYFISPTLLSVEPNPEGDIAEPGRRNLYLSNEGQITFVATVTDRDVEGTKSRDGLGLLLEAVKANRAKVPARSNPDGSVLLFKSRAALVGDHLGGQAQIYRFDFDAAQLQCLSCNPTGVAASTDATLQVEDTAPTGATPYNLEAWLENLRADGRRAFFQSGEQLVANDNDGRNDVYEWEDQGIGSCRTPGGCLYLISSGQSGRDEYLWAVSPSGDDVFILSSDLLAGGDADETPSIYDARVNGGFAAPAAPPGECLGEACQPAAVAPNDPTPASSVFEGRGNVVEPSRRSRRCPKGKRAVRRGGKLRCVRRHKAKRLNHRHNHEKGRPMPGNGYRRAGK